MKQVNVRITDEEYQDLLRKATHRQIESNQYVSISKIATEYFYQSYNKDSTKTVSPTVSTDNISDDIPDPVKEESIAKEDIETKEEEPVEEENIKRVNMSDFNF